MRSSILASAKVSRGLAAGLLSVVAACGSNKATNDAPPSSTIDAAPITTIDAPTNPIIDAAPDNLPADAAPLVGTEYSLSIGPIAVAPGGENTQCVVLQLNNAAPMKIHQFHNVLGLSSHHLIVYRDNVDTAVNETPTNCQPFAGALNPPAQGGVGGVSPLMISQVADDELTLPDGVGYTFAANQFIRLELHYINTTDQPVMVTATANFYAVPDDQITNEADFLFIGDPDINIAAGQMATVSAYFAMPSTLNGANIFAFTGHTHKFGTDMQVTSRPSKTGADTAAYNPLNFLWSDPQTIYHNPPLVVPDGGGFDFHCDYTNTSTSSVSFGESAKNEMCFFWAYYYPSVGAHVCFHTDQFAGGIDLCCPEAGAQICSMLSGLGGN